MKEKSNFRLISIGFLSGIVFSGLILLSIKIVQNHHQKYLSDITSVTTDKYSKGTPSKTTGLIDLNLATMDELMTLPGIGEAKAIAILNFRDNYGAYEDISELTYVPGIGTNLFNSIRDLVIINRD